MNSIVCKFGGSSLADASAFQTVADILKDKNRRFVVVSAPGKRYKEDKKITDLLIDCFSLSSKNENYEKEFGLIVDRFVGLVKDLNINLDLKPYLDEINREIKLHTSYDYVLSRGEFLNAKIASCYLGFKFLDAKDIIFFDKDGKVDLSLSKKMFYKKIDENSRYVIPGFYGIDTTGNIKTFSRGGSDLTGAIIAVLSNSSVYENFTDVDGVYDVDPNKCKKAKLLRRLSFSEMRKMSSLGAGVLHPDCSDFLESNNIVLNIRNTFNLLDPGTMVSNEPKPYARSITGKKGYLLINFEGDLIAQSRGKIEDLKSFLESIPCKIQKIIEGVDSISFVVNLDDNLEDKIDKINCNIGVKVSTQKVALVTIFDSCFNEYEIWQDKVFDALSKINFEILFITKSTSDISVIIGIKEEDFDLSIEQLYLNLFDK